MIQKFSFFLVTLAVLLSIAGDVWAEEYTKRLHAPATVKGFIGGESHDSYVIHARKGQVMTVQISWRPEHDTEGDNRAEFWVGERPDFDGDGAAKFGKESNKGKRWSGIIPATAKYYIYVVAHPTAHYTLRVIVK